MGTDSEVISRRSRPPSLGSVSALAQAAGAGQEGKGSREWGGEFWPTSLLKSVAFGSEDESPGDLRR